MPNTKTFILYWSETGKTTYGIIVREADAYRLNDADGAFASAPADPYVSLTEDSVIKGRYVLSEARTVWDDGEYTYAIYKQVGGSPAPVSDQIIGTGKLQIKTDTEAVVDVSSSTLATSTALAAVQADLNNPDQYKADVSNLDVAVSSRLAGSAYVAPDNTTLTLISKWIQNRLKATKVGTVSTVILYDDDGTTPLKTWTHDSATGIRTKAT